MDRIKNRLRVKESYSSPNDVGVSVERCLNPWNDNCGNTDIALYIMYKGERIPICWRCWSKISRKDV
ncbi:MAG: hypothetical protein QXU95_03645, partial [Candidatus Bathyarchaeia archaeon]